MCTAIALYNNLSRILSFLKSGSYGICLRTNDRPQRIIYRMPRNFLTLFVLLNLFMIFTFSFGQRHQRRSYGESCSKSQRCDNRAWLTCLNSKCECLYPEDMIYNASISKCVSKADSQCKFDLPNPVGDALYQYSVCIDDATCGHDGNCLCPRFHHAGSNGSCVPSRQHNEPCDSEDSNNKCDSNLGLECINAECQCNDNSIFSEQRGTCMGLAGEDCVKGACIDLAQCGFNSQMAFTCVCLEGYFRNSERTCSLRQGLMKNCTEDNQCLDTLTCSPEGFCTCSEKVSAVKLTDGVVSCVGKAGSPCIQSECVPNAVCQSTNQEKSTTESMYTTAAPTLIVGTCSCKDGYVTTKDNKCGKGHYSKCEKHECASPLVCQGQYCECRYSNQIFSEKSKTCLIYIHGPCTSNEDCIEKGFCKLYANQTHGACACEDGYVENVNGDCNVKIGGACVSNYDCDSSHRNTHYAACIDGHCDCGGFGKLGPDGETCLTMIGGECGDNLYHVPHPDCVENAHCLVRNKRFRSGRCTCDEGFVPTSEHICAANEELQN